MTFTLTSIKESQILLLQVLYLTETLLIIITFVLFYLTLRRAI